MAELFPDSREACWGSRQLTCKPPWSAVNQSLNDMQHSLFVVEQKGEVRREGKDKG